MEQKAVLIKVELILNKPIHTYAKMHAWADPEGDIPVMSQMIVVDDGVVQFYDGSAWQTFEKPEV